MSKQYAYCPRGLVEMIEKRTADSIFKDDDYPIKHFYHSEFLLFFKEIPEEQQDEIQLLWIWDETENRFIEPQIGQEVEGELYIGTIPKERIYEILQTGLQLQQENLNLVEANAAMEEQLTSLDETAIALYEISENQEATNIAQDEALIELYELTAQ